MLAYNFRPHDVSTMDIRDYLSADHLVEFMLDWVFRENAREEESCECGEHKIIPKFCQT